jgi:hypothetical protein
MLRVADQVECVDDLSLKCRFFDERLFLAGYALAPESPEDCSRWPVLQQNQSRNNLLIWSDNRLNYLYRTLQEAALALPVSAEMTR